MRLHRQLSVVAALMLILGVTLTGAAASAAPGLDIYVGYMDTHTVGSSSQQPSPWPYKDPSSYVGTPCSGYPSSTTCWDASAVRLVNSGGTDITGVHVVVLIGSRTYNLWGSSQTVQANGMLVLTETGGQNSTNFDGSDYPPNAYNGGNTASCANSGAIPVVRVTVGGVTTDYKDNGQVLNGGGVDSGHCLNGKFVSGRMDESHPWVQISAGAPTAPSAPQSLAATAGSGSVTLSWAAPASNGGAAVTGYNLYRGTTPGGESATPVASNVTTTSFTDTGRTNGTTYYYTVAAVNSVGSSAQSNEASATAQAVQASVPSAPQALAATATSQSVSLTWSAPSSDGGSPVTGYNVYRGTTPGGEAATPVASNLTAPRLTDNGLTNGTTYYYKVAAVNAVGVGAQSAEASATPRASAPSAPQTLVASGGNGSVALSWSAPVSDGGSGVTGYNVYRGTTAGGEATTPVASNVTTTGFVDSSVTNGTTYYYTIAAVNAVGTSPPSGEASATPRAGAPSAPLAPTASPGNGSVGLSWSVPASDGGSTITGYNVYRGTTAGGESTTPVASNLTTTGFADSSVTNGTTYFYKVAAVNGIGTSPQSSEVSATPQQAGAAAYVGRVASLTAAASRTTSTVTAGSAGVAGGHTLVVTLLLSSTSSVTGSATVKDSAGNTYTVARDVNDGSAGDRTVTYVAVNVHPLAAGGAITLTYPSSAETHLSVDEFAGVTGVDTSAGATGTGSSFSSGSASTSQANEILVGDVGVESGSKPAFAAGWTALPALAVSTDYLDTAYRLLTATGSYAATGTISGQWMAAVVGLRTN
jgi:fibronectin type 3 domain-containing protein